MNPSHQQQLFLSTIENDYCCAYDDDDDDDDYLQVLDAGEHMYGMFVADDQDLYAYLNITSEDPMNASEDIEDIISRSLVPSPLDNNMQTTTTMTPQAVEGCCTSFSDMHLVGKGQVNGAVTTTGCNNHDSDNESAKTGRLTPTRNEHDDHDAMSQ